MRRITIIAVTSTGHPDVELQLVTKKIRQITCSLVILVRVVFRC